jgi:hypothetical protein
MKQWMADFQYEFQLHYRAPLTSAFVFEKYPGRHVHLLVASSVPIDQAWIERWFKQRLTARPGVVDVREFDWYHLPYALKEIDMDAEWYVVGLHYWQNREEGRRDRRRAARHQARLRGQEATENLSPQLGFDSGCER